MALPFTLAGRLTCPEHGGYLVFLVDSGVWACPAGHECHAVRISDVVREIDRITLEAYRAVA